MPDRPFIRTLKRRLMELGCPPKRIRRLVQEVAEHHHDLKQAALAEGLAEAGAEVRADIQLGDPLVLAEQAMVALRQSSWWGRHRLITFSLLPVLLCPVLWLAILALEFSLVVIGLGYGWNMGKLSVLRENPIAFQYLIMTFQFMDCVAIAVVSLFFCWLARRSAVGRRWLGIAIFLCSVWAWLSWAEVKPHNIFLGFNFNLHFHMHWLQWLKATIPLLVAAAVYARARRRLERLREQMA